MDAWGKWDVVWRDVKILDAENRIFATYNLTLNDLGLEENRAALKDLFLAAAEAADSDNDQLPDAWERRYFPDTAAGRPDDPDGDGVDNFSEFVFGSDPTKADSSPSIAWEVVQNGTGRELIGRFMRPAGYIFDYFAETSPDLREWTSRRTEIRALLPRNLYDGTGRIEASYSVSLPEEVMTKFLRVRAAPSEQTAP